MQILIFGDSITYGAWDEKGGWASRLRAFTDKKHNFGQTSPLVYNLGVDGDTTEGLLKRLDSEARPRMWPDSETIIIFDIGSNDSLFVHSTKRNMVSKEKLEENTRKLIGLARKITPKVVFLGMIPIDEARTVPLSWDKNLSYKMEYIKAYKECIKSVCRKRRTGFIDLFEEWMRLDYKKMLKDGIHPDSRGHELIFNSVKEFLLENKWI
ncbi:MAG: hypothetical protein HY518_04695 [Candidatus Aenigmarchaeota archaeon]|nr:hypothetical protein [Candidatus Aenigmarchaeota archaeon]